MRPFQAERWKEVILTNESVRKLLSGLLTCIARKNKPERCRSCPYYHDRDCRDTLMRDAAGYVLMVENGKHMFDKCVEAKDLPIGQSPDGLEG